MADSRREKRRDTRRRFEQWVKNPRCEANTVSAVYGVSMADVAKHEGFEPTMGQSPFAIIRGQNFERRLFDDGAKLLREALENEGVLERGTTGFADFRLHANGGPLPDLNEALEQTTTLLQSLGEPLVPAHPFPALVAGAAVSVPGGIMLPEALLVLDALVIRTNGKSPQLVIGEIKTYPDRGGHTDSAELALARAQAGVYLHGLQLVIDDLGLRHQVAVSNRGFLVLTRPGSNAPSVRPDEQLEYQAKRAERGFEQLREAAKSVHGVADPSNEIKAICRATTAYEDSCISFCDLAPRCHQRALEQGDPAVLGNEVAKLLGDFSLTRVEQLLDGGPPESQQEIDLVQELKRAQDAA